jgi:hypothetical protein
MLSSALQADISSGKASHKSQRGLSIEQTSSRMVAQKRSRDRKKA